MPTQFQWWISKEDGSELTGPFLTKELATSNAVLNGIFKEGVNNRISLYVLEATSRTIEDFQINAENVIEDLTLFYSDYGDKVFKSISSEDLQVLEKSLNEAFHIWARDRDLLLPGHFVAVRNEETINMPKPDHARKIE